jgi:hypothetical protein
MAEINKPQDRSSNYSGNQPSQPANIDVYEVKETQIWNYI